jgi:hypothetical protein
MNGQAPRQQFPAAQKEQSTQEQQSNKPGTKTGGKTANRVSKWPQIPHRTTVTEVWVDLNSQVSPSDETDTLYPRLSQQHGGTPNLKFPSPKDFRYGMLRSEVERVYGIPTLSTMQTRSGRLFQKYVYVKKDRSAVTVALLEDGRVLNAIDMPQ